jgi:hypothetical protein
MRAVRTEHAVGTGTFGGHDRTCAIVRGRLAIAKRVHLFD